MTAKPCFAIASISASQRELPKAPSIAFAGTRLGDQSPAKVVWVPSRLDNNYDPAWFKPRRDDYEALVRGPMLALVADLLTLAAARKLPLTGDPAKAVFRESKISLRKYSKASP